MFFIMAKCGLCKEHIEKTFLGKIHGTFVKGKPICSSCQKKGVDVKEILEWVSSIEKQIKKVINLFLWQLNGHLKFL